MGEVFEDKEFITEGIETVLKAKKLTLEELLSQINSENLHESIDFGLPAGEELL